MLLMRVYVTKKIKTVHVTNESICCINSLLAVGNIYNGTIKT